MIRAFKVDFCLASVIKWLTKWHMDKKAEFLNRAKYYIDLCDKSNVSDELFFALRMYCMVNKFMKDNSSSCLLVDVVWDIKNKNLDDAHFKLVKGWAENGL